MDWPLDLRAPLPFVSNIPEWMLRTKIAPSKVSFAWRAANDAIYTPIYLPAPMTVKQIYVWNGATVSGNIDLGIYSAEPLASLTSSPYAEFPVPTTRIVSSGSTAQAGTNTVQEINITDTGLAAGLYFLAMSMDNITGTVLKLAGATGITPNGWHYLLGQLYTEPGVFPLAATALSGLAIDRPIPAPLLAAGGVA